jgi:hypothetical protein
MRDIGCAGARPPAPVSRRTGRAFGSAQASGTQVYVPEDYEDDHHDQPDILFIHKALLCSSDELLT